MTDKLIIKKRGEDNHKTFSIRLREDTVAKIDEYAKRTNRSRNELIQILLEFGLNNCEIQ